MIAEKVYDALPRQAQDFLRASDVEVAYHAQIPDKTYSDNLWQLSNCEGEGRFHSMKLQWDRKVDTMTRITGSVDFAIASEARTIHNAVTAGKFDEAREHYLEVAHYAVDACTLPHLSREMTAEQHGAFESAIKDYMVKEEEFPVEQQLLQHPSPLRLITKNLRAVTQEVCEETVRTQLDRVLAIMAKGKVTDDVALCQEIVARCAGFTLAVWLALWRVIARLSPGVEL